MKYKVGDARGCGCSPPVTCRACNPPVSYCVCMPSKYKVRDRVRVKKNADDGQSGRAKYSGKEVEIERIFEDGSYGMKGIALWVWRNHELEPMEAMRIYNSGKGEVLVEGGKGNLLDIKNDEGIDINQKGTPEAEKEECECTPASYCYEHAKENKPVEEEECEHKQIYSSSEMDYMECGDCPAKFNKKTKEWDIKRPSGKYIVVREGAYASICDTEEAAFEHAEHLRRECEFDKKDIRIYPAGEPIELEWKLEEKK